MNHEKEYSLLFAIIVTLSFTLGCEKGNIADKQNEPQFDTIFPLDYFPVFPGSYWKYVDSAMDTNIVKADPSYQKDYYTHGSAAYLSDTFYVPVYDETPIWGYEAHTGPISHSGSYPLTRILSESRPVGSSWEIAYWSGRGISRKITAKDTTITIASNSYYPTIVVEEYFSEGPSDYIWIAKRYYTKNIGLIREDINEDSTIKVKEITDYHINN